jgi:integrase
MMKKHLLPVFGDRPLSSLGKGDIRELQAKLVKELQLSNKTVNNVTSLAHKMMDDCVSEFELITSNPFSGYKRLSVKKPSFAFWEIDERDQFLACCLLSCPAYHDLFYLALNTGCRFGEIEGLQRGDLDFKNSRVTVQRKWNEKTRQLDNWLKMNKGPRYITMNTGLQEILGKYRFWGADDFVFGPQNRQKVRKELVRVANACGVAPLKFHDLRHTFPSNLARLGTPLVYIQQLMGHETIAMTMKYAHLGPDATKGCTEVLVTKTDRRAVSGIENQGVYCG